MGDVVLTLQYAGQYEGPPGGCSRLHSSGAVVPYLRIFCLVLSSSQVVSYSIVFRRHSGSHQSNVLLPHVER
jgi:hypothetical protein